MANIETLHVESNLEKEINEALNGFSSEEMQLKNSITNKNILSRTKEQMENYLES
jgi:hypothetical protein